jgi:hypothetical protein
VLVSSSNAEAWIHQPTQSTVTVSGGSVRIPFLLYTRSGDGLAGMPAVRLASFREAAPFEVPAAALEAVEPALVPPALQAPPAGAPDAGAGKPQDLRLTAKLKLKGRRATVSGAAPAGARVRVEILRKGKRVARKTVTAKKGRYVVKLRIRGRTRALKARVRAAGITTYSSPSRR